MSSSQRTHKKLRRILSKNFQSIQVEGFEPSITLNRNLESKSNMFSNLWRRVGFEPTNFNKK